jgi:hypothetical protein
MSEEEIHEENDEESSTTRKSSQRILNKPKKLIKIVKSHQRILKLWLISS